jgi:hypothetical protein
MWATDPSLWVLPGDGKVDLSAERPSGQIIAHTLNFSSREKINYKIFRSAREGNVMSRHRTTYNRERSKSTPAC